MKKIVLLLLGLFVSLTHISAQNLKPYTIGGDTSGNLDEQTNKVKTLLQDNGIEVIGEYTPAEDANRRVITFTSSDLKSAVKTVGGRTGFAAALRIGITQKEDRIRVSYTTPAYWGNAYFRKDYEKVAEHYISLADKLSAAFAGFGTNTGKTFGSEKGVSTKKLMKYKYMFGMPKFDKTHELNEFTSYQEAISTIDANLSTGVANLEKVYSIEFEDLNLKLYGIGLSGEKGEGNFMPTIDFASPKHTAFLPYEMLVWDNKVYMLHGRYRIALSFPDLSMGTFMKIVKTPGNIKNLLTSATKKQ